MSSRAALFVDGFNLYHAIEDLNQPHLKWCDLWRLGELIIPSQTERLTKVVFCTAFYPGDSEKKWRHTQYMNALRIAGVDIVLGHYTHEQRGCRECGATWIQQNEKQTDINLAINLFNAAVRDECDVSYLLTADSDQAATVRSVKEFYPSKKIVTVSPPGRNFSVHIQKHCDARIALSPRHIERCLFPQVVLGRLPDQPHGRRPREYDPPQGWTPSAPSIE